MGVGLVRLSHHSVSLAGMSAVQSTSFPLLCELRVFRFVQS